MANSPQAAKRAKQAKVREARNAARKSRIRTALRQFEAALTSGDKGTIGSAFTKAMSELQRGVTKGVMKQSTVSRKTSRLAASVKRAQEGSQPNA